MPSSVKLFVLALVASTASPALAGPTYEKLPAEETPGDDPTAASAAGGESNSRGLSNKAYLGMIITGGLALSAALLSGLLIHHHNKRHSNRMFEASEGRATAELVERALGDLDLDE